MSRLALAAALAIGIVIGSCMPASNLASAQAARAGGGTIIGASDGTRIVILRDNGQVRICQSMAGGAWACQDTEPLPS